MLSACASLLLATAVPSPALWFTGHSTLTVPPSPALDIRRTLTIEAWVWPGPETSRNAFTYIVSKNLNNTGYGLLTIGRDEKRLQATGWAPGIDVFGNKAPIGRWTHLAYVKTATDARMF